MLSIILSKQSMFLLLFITITKSLSFKKDPVLISLSSPSFGLPRPSVLLVRIYQDRQLHCAAPPVFNSRNNNLFPLFRLYPDEISRPFCHQHTHIRKKSQFPRNIQVLDDNLRNTFLDWSIIPSQEKNLDLPQRQIFERCLLSRTTPKKYSPQQHPILKE